MPTVRSAALAAGLTALCLLTVVAGATAQGGPEDVQQQLMNARSRGDVTAALALFRCCLPERSDAHTARFIEWEEAHPSTGE